MNTYFEVSLDSLQEKTKMWKYLYFIIWNVVFFWEQISCFFISGKQYYLTEAMLRTQHVEKYDLVPDYLQDLLSPLESVQPHGKKSIYLFTILRRGTGLEVPGFVFYFSLFLLFGDETFLSNLLIEKKKPKVSYSWGLWGLDSMCFIWVLSILSFLYLIVS